MNNRMVKVCVALGGMLLSAMPLPAHPIPGRPYLPSMPEPLRTVKATMFGLRNVDAMDLAELLNQIYTGTNSIPIYVSPMGDSITIFADTDLTNDLTTLIREIEKNASSRPPIMMIRGGVTMEGIQPAFGGRGKILQPARPNAER